MKISQAKRRFLMFFFCFVGSIFLLPSAFATEKINNFNSEVIIQKDAIVLVTETIVYDFGPTQRHGIFREIPVGYKKKKGKNSKLSFKLYLLKMKTAPLSI